jgi:hypothetical protein
MIRDVHPGSLIQRSKRHRIPDPDPQHNSSIPNTIPQYQEKHVKKAGAYPSLQVSSGRLTGRAVAHGTCSTARKLSFLPSCHYSSVQFWPQWPIRRKARWSVRTPSCPAELEDPAPDTDRFGSASFCRFGIGIGNHGMPIRIQPIPIRSIGIN